MLPLASVDCDDELKYRQSEAAELRRFKRRLYRDVTGSTVLTSSQLQQQQQKFVSLREPG